MKLLKLALALAVSHVLLYSVQTTKAEQKFTPWKQGDYQIEVEKPCSIIDAKISGGYEARYDIRRKEVVMGDSLGSKINQDIILDINSVVNRNISLRVTIGNRSPLLEDQDVAYRNQFEEERGNTRGETGMDLVFRQAYLEYNHNPSAALKIGKHYIYPGDGKGLIFQGEALGLTQECSMGTWCYYIGVARLGSKDNALFWGHLRYPVYQSGTKVTDPWRKEGVRNEVALNVEFFRVSHRGRDMPVSRSGSWTGEHSVYHDSTSDNASDRRVYYDNDKVEYMGFNLKWYFHKLNLDFTFIGLSGDREYYSGGEGNSDSSSLGSRAMSGSVYVLNADYMFKNYWKLGLTLFMSSGNKAGREGTRYWEKDSDAFQEVQKGNYYDAMIYFDVRNRLSDQYLLSGTATGDGHSVSNLQYLALKYSMKMTQMKMDLDVSLYSFRRTNPVFTLDDIGNAKKESKIGEELDVKLRWMLEKNLKLDFFLAFFLPGGAYSVNDSIMPLEDEQDLFSLLGASCTYTF